MTTESRRPRLLLVSHSYRPERTPPARRLGAVVAALRSAGWDVDVVAPGGVRPFAGPDGERVLPTPRLPLGEAGRNGRFAEAVAHALLAVPRGMATRRPDVVVATVPALPMVVPGVVLSRLWRRPLVLEMRDAWPDLIEPSGMMGPERPRIGVRNAVRRTVHRAMTRIQREAATVVTTTDAFADVLLRRTRLGILERLLELVLEELLEAGCMQCWQVDGELVAEVGTQGDGCGVVDVIGRSHGCFLLMLWGPTVRGW